MARSSILLLVWATVGATVWQTSAAWKLGGGGGASGTSGASSGDAGSTITDAWATNPTLKMARRLMKGEGVGGFLSDMVVGKELEEVFSHPVAAHTVLQRFPMFQALEGVKELAAKKPEDFTQEDGLSVLGSVRKFVTTAMAGLDMVGNQGKYAKFMRRYADLADGAAPADDKEATLQNLLNGAKAGDKESTLKLHDMVADDVWGGAVDLEAFGSRGIEPATLTQLRELAMEDSDIWSLITGDDPLVHKILSNPTLAFDAIPDFERTVPASA